MDVAVTAHRSCHYENAFEHWLDRIGIPFVQFAHTPRGAFPTPGLKKFDYIIQPPDGPPVLVELKGRQSNLRPKSRLVSWNSWMKIDDLEGLTSWSRSFGPRFKAAFVFAFWMMRLDESQGAAVGCHQYVGRNYSFWGIDLADYRRCRKVRSIRWQTIDLPNGDFAQHAWSPMSRWTAARRCDSQTA